MKFPYHVFHNGVSYKPFEEVPIEEEPVKVEEPVNEEVPFAMNEPIIEDTPSESPVKAVEYSKTDINRMNVTDLKELAKEYHIDGAEELKGADLKTALIKKFGL